LRVDDHRLYILIDWRSRRLSKVRVVKVVDEREVVVRLDGVRNAAAPLRKFTCAERNSATKGASTRQTAVVNHVNSFHVSIWEDAVASPAERARSDGSKRLIKHLVN
jgi:hypothetical protein